MRKVTTLAQPKHGIVRLMLHEAGGGVYLFQFATPEDGPCRWDGFYATVEDAEEATRQSFGVGAGDWSTIDDPPPGTGQDRMTTT